MKATHEQGREPQVHADPEPASGSRTVEQRVDVTGILQMPVAGLTRGSHPPTIRRRLDSDDPLGGTELSPELAGVLERRRGRGEPLPAKIAQSMGEAMGADLEAVRIHTGAEPAALTRSVQAVAFTQGTDIYFGAGAYSPDSPAGRHLLAHELAHTIQQGGGGAQRPIIGAAADPVELEAERVADGVLRHLRRRADRAEVHRSQVTAGPQRAPLSRLRGVRRMPVAFTTTPAAALKSGYGFLGVFATPWDEILKEIRAYSALQDDDLPGRSAALTRFPALIAAWENHHKIGTGVTLNADERAKATALTALRNLIDNEHRELASGGVTVDERRQTVAAPRFKGDYLLEKVIRGQTTIKKGDNGLYVTKVQQALADTSHLTGAAVSGTFDDATETGVKKFQKEKKVPEQGVVDRPTMVALDKLFTGHSVEKTLAQAPTVAAKDAPGEFVWGAAPAELTAGTRVLDVPNGTAALEAVKTSQRAGPGGALPTFVSDLPGKGSYETRLKTLVLQLVDLQYDHLAKGKSAKRSPSDLLDWDHIKSVAARSKAATDEVFGKFAAGPPLSPGAGIHDAWDTKVTLLTDVSQQDKAAIWRVEKLLTGDEYVRHIDREHGAIQSRGPEKVIVDRVTAQIAAERRDKLIETHKAWPAFASGGEVNIQRFKESTTDKNRDIMWDLFQTVVHEYLHTLEHSRYRGYQGKLGQQAGSFTLREGVVEYFTYTVLESVKYDDALRILVEGEFHDDKVKHPIPRYHGYGERANAEKLAGVVGARNVMAAFFLGDVEKIGGAA